MSIDKGTKKAKINVVEEPVFMFGERSGSQEKNLQEGKELKCWENKTFLVVECLILRCYQN